MVRSLSRKRNFRARITWRVEGSVQGIDRAEGSAKCNMCKGDRYLKVALIEAACAAVKKNDNYLVS